MAGVPAAIAPSVVEIIAATNGLVRRGFFLKCEDEACSSHFSHRRSKGRSQGREPRGEVSFCYRETAKRPGQLLSQSFTLKPLRQITRASLGMPLHSHSSGLCFLLASTHLYYFPTCQKFLLFFSNAQCLEERFSSRELPYILDSFLY